VPNLSVSGRHARIVLNDGEAWVEDLNSTNGTYINNRLISRQTLNHNDELVIGKTRLRFQNANARRTLADADLDRPTNATAGSAPAVEVPDFVRDAAHANDAQTPAAAQAASSEAVFSSLASELSESQPAAAMQAMPEQAGQHVSASLATAGSDDLDASDLLDDSSLSLSEKAKLAMGRPNAPRPQLAAVNGAINGSGAAAARTAEATTAALGASAGAAVASGAAALATQQSRVSTGAAVAAEGDVAVSEAPSAVPQPSRAAPPEAKPTKHEGAVIEIKNGAKSGQVLPIDKPVTTLGRPGIQIAAIMRKPDGYFLMHIESDDSVDRPTLNNDAIGDEPMLLQSGDELNVAGIDVEFMLG